MEILLDRSARLLAAVAAIGLLSMLIHVCADILLDMFFNHPIPGTAEVVAYYYMVGAVFLPLPLVEVKHASIKVDLIYGLMPRLVKRVMLLAAYAAQSIFFGILARQTAIDAIEGFQKGQMVEGRIDVLIWPGIACLPVAFFLAAMVSVLSLARVGLGLDDTYDPDNTDEEGETFLQEAAT
jgi:TRAP-type C4-dicarboxylate transport system permease small subunit